jgi:hypothetical protein
LLKQLTLRFHHLGYSKELGPPPNHWAKPFQAMANNLELKHDLGSAFDGVRNFYASLDLDGKKGDHGGN